MMLSDAGVNWAEILMMLSDAGINWSVILMS